MLLARYASDRLVAAGVNSAGWKAARTSICERYVGKTATVAVPKRRGALPGFTERTPESVSNPQSAETLLAAAAAARAFGPDVRRMLAAGVHLGASELTHTRTRGRQGER